MFNHFIYKIKTSPLVLLFPVFVLLIIGLNSLYSISALQSEVSDSAFYKQLLFLGPAIMLMFFLIVIPKKIIHEHIYLVYFIVLILVFLPFFGPRVAGTYRWIDIGLPFGFQPSEISKWVIVITLARYLSDRNLKFEYFSSIGVPFIITLVPSLIVLNQPDLGTSFVMMSPLLPMLYWVGARPFHLFLLISPVLSVFLAFNVTVFSFWIFVMATIIIGSRYKLWYSVSIFFSNVFLGLIFPILWNSLRPYQRNRILTLINPELDPLGAGYQIIQSKTALGSGGFLGKGWGEGTQTQLKFLPVQESDFIVSVIGEEQGFVVILIMLVMFLLLISKILLLSFNISDKFSSLVLIGISCIFLSHIFVNCSMAAGMIPVKGLPLPFISYGGSFLLSSFMMLGIILNMGREEA